MKGENKRISHFDWIRGCMIIWMLVYHISLNPKFRNTIQKLTF